MQWPWVSRDTLSETVTLLVGKFSEMSVEKDRQWQARYDALLEKYHALALPAPVASPAPYPVLAEPREPSLIKRVIHEQSMGDSRLEGHLRTYANELRGRGMQEDEVAAELTRWTTSDDVFTQPEVQVA